MSRGCYVDEAGCTVCPELPASPATPTRVVPSANNGWNAGGNSIASYDGDVIVQDKMCSAPLDMFIGFKSVREAPISPYRLQYAFRFYTLTGTTSVQVWEGTQMRLSGVGYTLGDDFAIVRLRNVVRYFSGERLVYTSATPSFGPLIVSACLFGGGDTLP